MEAHPPRPPKSSHFRPHVPVMTIHTAAITAEALPSPAERSRFRYLRLRISNRKSTVMIRSYATITTFLCLAHMLPAALIVAHRGASYDAPENTIAASRLAWKQGADAVELDVHLTADNRVIVIHDRTIERTTGQDGEVSSMMFDALRRLDAGKWKDPTFAGARLPTLGELLGLVPKGKGAFVEIKPGPEIIPALHAELNQAGLPVEQIAIISFNYESLRESKRVMPQYKAYWLVGRPSEDPAHPSSSVPDLIKACTAAGLDGLDLNFRWQLTPADVSAIRAAGLSLHVWTIDDPAEAKKWIALGVDTITTNRPDWLRNKIESLPKKNARLRSGVRGALPGHAFSWIPTAPPPLPNAVLIGEKLTSSPAPGSRGAPKPAAN